jgi:hypothetical protein
MRIGVLERMMHAWFDGGADDSGAHYEMERKLVQLDGLRELLVRRITRAVTPLCLLLCLRPTSSFLQQRSLVGWVYAFTF